MALLIIMTSIIKANKNNSGLLSEVAKLTFIESHGSCAQPEDVNFYIAEKYSTGIFEKELINEKNNYYLIIIKTGSPATLILF